MYVQASLDTLGNRWKSVASSVRCGTYKGREGWMGWDGMGWMVGWVDGWIDRTGLDWFYHDRKSQLGVTTRSGMNACLAWLELGTSAVETGAGAGVGAGTLKLELGSWTLR